MTEMLKTSGKIKVCKSDIQLKPTLCGGQSFRWKTSDANSWIGVFKNLVWILYQNDNSISYECFRKETDANKILKDHSRRNDSSNFKELLCSYLRLNVDLNYYYEIWSKSDPHFSVAAAKMFGIRILNQETTENIFSFICSSNNNIKRISSMVEKLCEFYGEPIAEVNGKQFYSFPTIESLAQPAVESNLRKAGFGYRAKFIYQAACTIEKLGGHDWLEKLKCLPYKSAKNQLMQLPGVGPKVADCICLMSLGHMEAIPIDTHIFKIATELYLPHLKKYKNLNNGVYAEIGDHFRSLHGNYAGWANTVLFCSDVKLLKSSEKNNEILKKDK